MRTTIQIRGRPVELSERQTETLKLIAEGKSNKEIGVALRIAVKTVEKHRLEVMRKLGLHDRVLLAHFAISRGLVLNIFNQEPTQ